LTVKGIELAVEDTFKWNDAIVHKISALQALSKEDFSSPMMARVHHDSRSATRRNHSATHLLQAALRKIAGEHIQQAGSRVDHMTLRFDFTHFKALTAEEVVSIEQQVNEWVLADLPIVTTIEETEKAKNTGAMALFGEKYGERVRVVTMGTISKELCGGTHASSTGRIGLFHIISESSISAGIRRIEAVTGMNTLHIFREKETIIAELTETLKISERSLPKRIAELLKENDSLKKSILKFSEEKVARQVMDIFAALPKNNGSISFVSRAIGNISRDSFTAIADTVSDRLKLPQFQNGVVVIGAVVDGKAQLFAAAGQAAVQKGGVHCGALVKEAAHKAGGSGGGSPIRAQAGCKEADRLPDALEAALQALKKKAGA
jgi:alanyl-tRNA synthetase